MRIRSQEQKTAAQPRSDDPWIFWLPVLYLYFVPFIGFQIKYDDDDDDDDWACKFRRF